MLQIGDLAIPDHLLAVAADKRYTDCTAPYLLCRKQCAQLQMQMMPSLPKVLAFDPSRKIEHGRSGQTSYQV